MFFSLTITGMYAPPTMMIALKRSMKLAGDFFDEKGWWYAVEAGASLGAVKVNVQHYFHIKLFLTI